MSRSYTCVTFKLLTYKFYIWFYLYVEMKNSFPKYVAVVTFPSSVDPAAGSNSNYDLPLYIL